MTNNRQDDREVNAINNNQALSDFRNHWTENGFNLFNGDIGIAFKAQIFYSSPKNSIVEQTNVHINFLGYGSSGKIEITETQKMSVDKYHLSILPAFGKYQLTSDTGELVITNTSQKMGGTYTIKILPIGEPDKF